MLPHQIIDAKQIKIDRKNVCQFYPCFERYSYVNCSQLGYLGPPITCQCPIRNICIKGTNEFRKKQQEQLGLDKPRLERENLTREERLKEMGIRTERTKIAEKETGFDITGYLERIRKEKEASKARKGKF